MDLGLFQFVRSGCENLRAQLASDSLYQKLISCSFQHSREIALVLFAPAVGLLSPPSPCCTLLFHSFQELWKEMLLCSPMASGNLGNHSFNQKASIPLLTKDPWLGVFLLFPKSSFSVYFSLWALLKQNQEFPALLSPVVFSLYSWQHQLPAPVHLSGQRIS